MLWCPTMGSITCLITVLLSLMSLGNCKEPNTCEAGHFRAGGAASVICYFHRNMKTRIGYHIYVVYYPPNTEAFFLGYDVLICSSLDQQTPFCVSENGYQLNGDISDRLTLTIPEVNEKFAGAYSCQTVPSDDQPVNTCHLTVTRSPDAAIPAAPGAKEEKPPVTGFPDVTISGVGEEKPRHSGGHAQVIVTAVLVPLILIIILVCYFKGRLVCCTPKYKLVSSGET